MIDLHTHSSASDGALPPAALIELAALRGIETIALTDHDTIKGLDEAAEEAAKRGIRFIPGIELEIEWANGEFHLLGLGIKNPSGDFKAMLSECAKAREKRNRMIFDKMNRMFALRARYEDIEAVSGGGSVGRPHFAEYLVRRQKVKNISLAFARYLGYRKPLYVHKPGLQFERAACAIHESGGIAVIAHPATLRLSISKLTQAVQDLIPLGLDGIEAWHPNAPAKICARYEKIAEQFSLALTAGSDFHGESLKDRRLGFTSGGLPIDNRFLPKRLAADSRGGNTE